MSADSALLREAHGWTLWLDDPHSLTYQSRFDLLNAEEKRRYRELREPRTGTAFLAAHVLCRMVLSLYANVDAKAWVFEAGQFGKPRIVRPEAGRDLHFNITHTRRLVICIVTRAGEIGVDAEDMSRCIEVDSVGRTIYANEEAPSAANQPGHLFETWVLKEAYLKAIGTGLSREPGTVTIDRSENQIRCEGWNLTLSNLGRDHLAATAAQPLPDGSAVRIVWRDASELFDQRLLSPS